MKIWREIVSNRHGETLACGVGRPEVGLVRSGAQLARLGGSEVDDQTQETQQSDIRNNQSSEGVGTKARCVKTATDAREHCGQSKVMFPK